MRVCRLQISLTESAPVEIPHLDQMNRPAGCRCAGSLLCLRRAERSDSLDSLQEDCSDTSAKLLIDTIVSGLAAHRYCRMWLHPAKRLQRTRWWSVCALPQSFFADPSATPRTCEGRPDDLYNYGLGRRSCLCNDGGQWGLTLLITCQQSVRLNMGPFTPGTHHVIHPLKCVIQITAVCCDGCESLNGMGKDLNGVLIRSISLSLYINMVWLFIALWTTLWNDRFRSSASDNR